MFLEQEMQAQVGTKTVSGTGYLYAIPHGASIYLVVITVPVDSSDDSASLQRTMISTFKIKE